MNCPTYAEFYAKAQSLGFHKLGVLTLDDLPLEGSGLEAWLNQGYHGEMQWMVEHLDKRLNPEALMPGMQSIVSVMINYYPGEQAPETEGKIARYAQGTDYHYVIKDKLRELLAWLQTFDPAIEGRPLTDSAPILEKALAIKAGLGWQGKHSNLISRDIGSWFFLGELLLNFRFPDAPKPEPMADLCGRCRKCIDACPTDAIVDSQVVDATKCISYWTIEYKGETFPGNISENLSGWMFGCDICQEVCPWNIKFQQPTAEAAFQPRPWNHHVRLADLETMTPEQFRVRYRKSPLKRPKLSGIQRNVRELKQARLKKTEPMPYG